MRRALVVIMFLLCAFALGQRGSTKRFEEINAEVPNNGSVVTLITVWHDKESGAEFICAAGNQIRDGWNQPVQTPPISCFTTGRVWK